MNLAEQLKTEIANSSLFDKGKVIEAVKGGISENGFCEILYYGLGQRETVYGSCHVECSTGKQCEAIAAYLRSEGFRISINRHPVSYRPIGYRVSL